MRDQARADLAAGAAERGTMSAEYEALPAVMPSASQLLLVLLALLLMVWKPGAYDGRNG